MSNPYGNFTIGTSGKETLALSLSRLRELQTELFKGLCHNPEIPRKAPDFMRFAGLMVFPSTTVPESIQKERLSKDVFVSDEFRNKTDAWLRSLFGETPCILVSKDCVYMHPVTYENFKVELNKKFPSHG